MIVGHAKLRQGAVSGLATDSNIAIGVLLDLNHGVIIDCSSSLALAGANQFLKGLIVGYSVVTDLEEVAQLIQERFIGLTSSAYIAALRDVQRQFLHLRAQPPAAPPE